MSRLIDADELTKVMTADWFLTMLVGTNDRYDVEEMLINCIDSVPLAYDIEKVVAELLDDFSDINVAYNDCSRKEWLEKVVRKGGADK